MRHTATEHADRLLRRREVERMTGLQKSSLYRMMRRGQFPEPVRLGTHAVRWRLSEITRWIETRPVSHGDRGDSQQREPQTRVA